MLVMLFIKTFQMVDKVTTDNVLSNVEKEEVPAYCLQCQLDEQQVDHHKLAFYQRSRPARGRPPAPPPPRPLTALLVTLLFIVYLILLA